MEDLERIVSNNIIELRKAHKWTQAELAEKINYSDKSVSKWERGEALPDLKILAKMAELFGVSIDFFVKENAIEEKKKYTVDKTTGVYRTAIALLAVVGIWLAVVVFYTYTRIAHHQNFWLLFVMGVPLSFFALNIFDRIWWNRKLSLIWDTGLCWSLISTVHLWFLYFASSHINLWMLYIIGVPLQIAFILLSFIRKSK